jgi:hypothetical protein
MVLNNKLKTIKWWADFFNQFFCSLGIFEIESSLILIVFFFFFFWGLKNWNWWFSSLKLFTIIEPTNSLKIQITVQHKEMSWYTMYIIEQVHQQQ